METPKTFKELFANTGIEPTTDESGNTHYNFKATMKEEPKQETLEKYIEREFQFNSSTVIQNQEYVYLMNKNRFKIAVNNILKYQKEQDKKMYSEEEVRKISLDFFYHWWNAKGSNTEQGFDKWFEQVKK